MAKMTWWVLFWWRHVVGVDKLFMCVGVLSRYWRWRVWEGRRYGSVRGVGEEEWKGLFDGGTMGG